MCVSFDFQKDYSGVMITAIPQVYSKVRVSLSIQLCKKLTSMSGVLSRIT